MLKKINKKQKIISLIILLILIGFSVLLLVKNRQKNSSTSQTSEVVKKKISQPVNIIPVSERPFMQLIPSSDGHYVTVNVLELKKPASQLTYEMEYQTGSMLQGFQGSLALNKLPAADRKLFGSQSAGGAITYHEDIKGGTLLAEFNGNEDYAVKSAWTYIDVAQNMASSAGTPNTFSSEDGKFSLTSQELNKYRYLVIYNTPGFPGQLASEPVSDVYTISADQSLSSVKQTVTVSFQTDQQSASIMAYDGQAWQTLDTSSENGQLTASAELMEAYLLVLE